MCDPITIAGIALTGASVAANSYANSEINSARDDALAAERIRQQGYQRETDALNQHSQDQYKDFGTKQDTRGQQLGDYFQQNQVPAAPAPTLMPASNSNIVVAENTKQQGKAQDYSNQQATALGDLRAFGDILGDNSRAQARDAAQIGEIGSFEKGSSNVLQQELQAANSAGSGMSFLGDLLGGIGGIGVKAGLSGAGSNLFGTASNVAAPVATGANNVLNNSSDILRAYNGPF